MIYRNKKGRLDDVLTRLGCWRRKRLLQTKSKRSFSIIFFINIFILFLFLAVQRLIKEQLTFFSIILWNKKERLVEVLTRLGYGVKKVFADKIENIFSILYFINIFILFTYVSIQKLIENPGKLLIDPLAKISIFCSMIHRNRKDRLGKVLARLGCGSKKGSCRQNRRDILLYLFYLYIYSHSKANRGAG